MTSIRVELDGFNALLEQLQDLGKVGEEVIEDTITDLVMDTHANAVDGIQRGPKTGRIYRRGTVTHQASAPGQYPASDTGRLASNVRFELPSGGSMTGRVGTNIQYGAYLEFGTSRMEARPWLLPSFEKAKANVEKELKAKLEGRI